MNDTLIDIPGYTVHGRLGKGGMAEVYLATQQSLQRKVAVKVLLSADDEEFNTRFIQEGHIVASLHTPSVITIYDINCLADGRYYLAMEFVPGGDLAQHKGEIFAPARALEIVKQIATGLSVVHEKGLIHRDIKPANILFRSDGTAVITDFGIAKDTQIDSELTHFGVAVGSPAYSSPEQTQCLRLDARSDIYSLGVIFLEMLTGSNPYRGANFTQTVMNHVQMGVPTLPEYLAVFQGVLNRMLAKDPNKRFADCRALLKALEGIDLGDPDATQVRPAHKVAGKAASVPPVEAASSSGAPSASPRRSMMPLLLVLTLLVAVGTGVAGWLYWQQQSQINALLAQAEQRLAEGQLVAPEQDSADHYFQQVLLIDDDNRAALEGLQRVLQARVASLVVLGDQRLSEGKLLEPVDDNADYYYRQALALDATAAGALSGLQRLLEARIAGYLSRAEQSIADKRLLTPEDDSAVFYYRQILALQADNAAASAGLLRVAELYRDLAKDAYARFNFPLALSMIERGLEVQPEHAELLQMQREHQRLQASARAARTQRQQEQAQQSKAEPEASKEEPNTLKRVWNNLFGQ